MFPSALAYASVLLWAAAAGLFAWYAALVARNVTYVTLADGRRQERRLPLSFRLLLPLAPNVERLFRAPAFAAARDRAGAMLVAGGFDGLLAPWEFLSLKLLLPLNRCNNRVIGVKDATMSELVKETVGQLKTLL